MTKIILCGCSGHMGHVVTEIAAADAEVEIVAGIDLSGTKDASYPVFASLKDCDVKADALIDFFIPEGAGRDPDLLHGEKCSGGSVYDRLYRCADGADS